MFSWFYLLWMNLLTYNLHVINQIPMALQKYHSNFPKYLLIAAAYCSQQ